MTLTLENYQSAFENMHDAIMVSQCKGGNPIVHVNQQFTKLTGYLLDDVIESPVECLYLNHATEQTECAEVTTLKNCMKNRDSMSISLIGYQKDGSQFYAEVAISQIKNTRGRTTHYLSVIRDVSEQTNVINQLHHKKSKLYEEVQSLKIDSKYDTSTGILNKNALNNEVKGLYAGAQRGKESFSIFFIGIDAYENLLSQLTPEQLQTVMFYLGGLLQNSMKRSSDIVFKYSESEFVICFTGQEQDNAVKFAEKLIEDVQNYNFNENLSISVSIGVVSEVPEQAMDLNQSILQADIAMHNARKKKLAYSE